MKRTMKNPKTGTYVWTPQEIEYLKKNYRDTLNCVLSEKLGKTKHAIAVKASQLGLAKSPLIVSGAAKRLAIMRRPESDMTADIICFYHRRDFSVEKIAREIRRPTEQVEEILERCIRDGTYFLYAKRESSFITSAMTARRRNGTGLFSISPESEV